MSMNDLTLVIGNKNYSSWSLRPWLALRNAGIPFTEKMLLLFDENWKEAIAAADAMFAPVVTRLDTYGVVLDEVCSTYSRAVLSLPAFVEWRDAALQEPWIVPEDEIC